MGFETRSGRRRKDVNWSHNTDDSKKEGSLKVIKDQWVSVNMEVFVVFLMDLSQGQFDCSVNGNKRRNRRKTEKAAERGRK